MAGIDVGGASGKRAVNRDINMIPFIDLLMVTVAFLLITAVWVDHQRISATAQVPGHEGKGPTEIDNLSKDLHVHMSESDFVLTWKQAGTVVSETRLPRVEVSDGPPRYDDLAEKIEAEWKLHGGHMDPSDHELDRCVFHSDNDVPFGEIVAVMDAIYDAKRDIALDTGGKRRVAVFNMAFAAR